MIVLLLLGFFHFSYINFWLFYVFRFRSLQIMKSSIAMHVVLLIKDMHNIWLHYNCITIWGLWPNSYARPFKSPGIGLYLPVSRLIKANLPVITNLSNIVVLYLYLPYFSLFACFSAFLLIFSIEKPELCHSLSVIGFESGFCLHPIGNSDGEIISKMALKNAHEDSSNLYEELACPLDISGQWSNGSSSQSFAFGSNLPVLI